MTKLNASKFLFVFEYQEKDLMFILEAIYKCYLRILASEGKIKNDENTIRDVFISDEYLENHLLKEELNIVEFQFDKEIQINDGRIDIRVFDMVKKMQGVNKPYYFIECKRLDGIVNPNNNSTLNHKYISNGINRFIEEKYPTYNEANGMLGFVIASCDISENCSFFSELEEKLFIENFKYSYISTHNTISNKKITLYHLMLDLSSKID